MDDFQRMIVNSIPKFGLLGSQNSIIRFKQIQVHLKNGPFKTYFLICQKCLFSFTILFLGHKMCDKSCRYLEYIKIQFQQSKHL